ncbi:MAG: AsmA-like C-terminal region-containing protein [Candidatus Gastranaerophilaceae bacterium]
MRFNIKFFIKFLFTIILVFIAIQSFYVFCLPKIVNIPSRVPVIQKHFSDKTNFLLYISEPKLKTYHNFAFSVEAKEISVSDKENKPVFWIKNPSFKIQPIFLLMKKLKVQEIIAEGFTFNTTRFSNKNFTSEIFFKKTLPFDIDLNGANIDLNHYKIYFDDQFLKKIICLEGSTFKIKPERWSLSKLITDGTLSINNEVSTFDLNVLSKFLITKKLDLKGYSASGKISAINLQTLSLYLDNIWGIKDAKGLINIKFNASNNSKTENVSEIIVQTQDISLNETNPEKRIFLKGFSELTVHTFVKGDKLNIDKLVLSSNNLVLNAQGVIEKYNKENPNLNISVIIPPSKAENIINILPYGICKEIDYIKKYGFYADVSGWLKIAGKLPEPKLYGNIEAYNAHALWNMKKNHNAEIKVSFQDTTANMNIDLKTDKNEYFKLKGKSSIYDKDWSFFDILTSEALDMKLVQAILTPVSEIFDFPIGPVPDLTVYSGTGSAKMHIKGKRLQKKESRINGYVKINDGKTVMKGLDAEISKLNLDLLFEQEKIKYVIKSAFLNNYPVTFDGISDTYGNVDFILKSKNINANMLHRVITNSSMLTDLQTVITPVQSLNGFLDTEIQLKGIVDVESRDFAKEMKKLDVTGHTVLHNNDVILRDFAATPIRDLNGRINFTNKSFNGKNLKAKFGNSSINIDVDSDFSKTEKNNITNLRIIGKSLKIKDSIKFLSLSNVGNIDQNILLKMPPIAANHSLNLQCKLINNILDLKSVYADINIFGADARNAKVISPKGNIKISNGNIDFKNLELYFDKSSIAINGQIKDFTSDFPLYQITAKGKDIAVATVCNIAELLSENIQKVIKNYEDYSGWADFNLTMTKKGAKGFIKLKKLGFKHLQSGIPIYFEQIPINITNNKISALNVNGYASKTIPVFFNFDIENYTNIPIIKALAATKINSAFVDRYINTKLSHPIKVTGDIDLSAEINGSVDSLKIFPLIKVNKNSDISYLSVSLEDTDTIRVLNGEITFNPKNITIENLELIKYYTDSNNKNHTRPLLSIKGKLSRKTLDVTEITLSTFRKLPAKLLNFIFKKSIIKSGTINGNLTYKIQNGIPKIIGIAELEKADIPMYNTLIKTGKIFANGQRTYITANGRTEDTDYSITSEIENSFPIKIKDLNINTRKMDLERLETVFNKWSIDLYMNQTLPVEFNISDVIVERGILKAQSIAYKSSPMENFYANFSLNKDSLLHFSTKDFMMAGGIVNGTIDYDFKSGTAQTKLKVKGIDANTASESFLGLKNQITGKLDGNVNLSWFGANAVERINNLNGKIDFHIENGSMPKLGSVEYLLRATNLLQSALTALSLNNIIELMKPFKTGTFSKISGLISVKNGKLKNMSIFSQGKTLSIFMTGDYNIAESEADVIIYGKLGKKTEGLLGPIGNISANSLFTIIPSFKNNKDYMAELKKIPDIDYKNKDVKLFRATVKGDINDDNVSTSFRWIK